MQTILSIVPYKIFPAKLGGQKGIALFNQYFSHRVKLVCVTVASNGPSQAADYTLLNVLSDSPVRYINLGYFFLIRRILRKNNITHLLLEHPYFGWLGILLKKFAGVKLIVHSHNIEFLRWKTLGKWWWPILLQYEKMTHRAADYNFFIQEEDRQLALHKFGLKEERCATITYGIDWDNAPTVEERHRCRNALLLQHGISAETAIFLFNGTLDYPPNLAALKVILNELNPMFIASQFTYKIIICGRGLPAELNELSSYKDKNVIYAGFTEDISLYFKAANVFLNPVVDGGGIKTKLVEAIGYGTRSVSTINGSIGVTTQQAGELLSITGNDDWTSFANAAINAAQLPPGKVPKAFFEHFYWGNIARKAASFIQ
ncbi:MAG TPA: glycosyltransferase [Chitinophagaceae bacterium]|nr:glycosyltransferase [Chitinophagaceae bacterium]